LGVYGLRFTVSDSKESGGTWGNLKGAGGGGLGGRGGTVESQVQGLGFWVWDLSSRALGFGPQSSGSGFRRSDLLHLEVVVSGKPVGGGRVAHRTVPDLWFRVEGSGVRV
jgi:hypothetical protein